MYYLQVYEKTPSTTLNADEAVSRGCALQCAILSPTFKVGTEGTVCTHTWYNVQGLCATVRHPQSYIQGSYRGNSLYPYLVQCPGAVRYSAPSSVLHSR